MPTFVPVFAINNNEFFVPAQNWSAETEQEALQIGWGASIVECIIWHARFTNRAMDVTDGILAAEANLCGTNIALISGPLFEDAIADTNLGEALS